MSRNAALIIMISLSLPIIVAWGNSATPTNTVSILPEDCRMLVGEEIPLALDGFIPPNAVVSWDVDNGGISSVLPGLNAIFVAPPEPTLVTISVSISPIVPGGDILLTRQCIVTSLNSAPNGLAQATGIDTIGMPLSTGLLLLFSLRLNSAPD